MVDLIGAMSFFSTGTTAVQGDISSIPQGSWMIAVLYQEGSYQTGPPPIGWTNFLSNNSQQSGTRAAAYARKIKQSGDNSISWPREFAAQSGGQKLVVVYGSDARAEDWIIGLIGVRSATNVVSGQSIQAGTSTTSVAPSVNVIEEGSLVISLLMEATAAAGALTITSGATQYYESGETGNIQSITVGYTDPAVGSTSAVVATVPAGAAQATNGQGVQIVIPPILTPEEPEGAVAYDGLGNETRVFLVTENGLATPELIPVNKGFETVSQMLGTPGFTWAHRGLTTFAEESLYAYTRAVVRGHGALEISFGRTSDGVWVGTHDNDLNRVVGTSGLPSINAMTWAQVQTYMIHLGLDSPKPFMRWEEIRDTYGESHVLILDPKNYNWGALQIEFLNMCDQLGPEKVVVKQYASDMSLASAAASRDYTTWGHTFDDFMSNPQLNTYLAGWDLLGIDYSSPQSDWNVLLATGKPVVGHIANNQAAYNTCIAKGASGVACTSYDIEPVSWWN